MEQELLKNKFIMRYIFKCFIYSLILFGCNKSPVQLDINQVDIKSWQDKNIKNLYSCCNDYKGSGMEIVMRRVFKRNVRIRVLQKLNYYKQSNIVEIFELYGNNNNNSIDVFVNEEESYFFNFKIVNDTIVDRKQNSAKVLSFEDKEDAIKNLTNYSGDCCDLGTSHPTIAIYSKLRVQNNRIEVLESYTK